MSKIRWHMAGARAQLSVRRPVTRVACDCYVPGMRVAALECGAIVRAMADAGDTHDASFSSAGTPPSTALASSATLFEPGELIGARYQVIRFVARGGMGEVYEAEDLELDLRLALKTIRPERVGDPASIQRLKGEVLAARRVSHVNVVRLYDMGFHVLDDQREVAFITMDLLVGETLDTYLRRVGPLRPEQAAPLVVQLARALDAAHAADVVHRDFKPQNVILLPGGPRGPAMRAVVTDFGLAEAGADRDDDGSMTMELVGTPAYMAPEQVSRVHPVTGAADIYALGVVMFEMVTGRRPFVDTSVLTTATPRVEEPAPSPRVYAHDLPDVWEATILRCLEREPRARFARATEVARALDIPAGSLVGTRITGRAVAIATLVLGLAAAVLMTRSSDHGTSVQPSSHDGLVPPSRPPPTTWGFVPSVGAPGSDIELEGPFGKDDVVVVVDGKSQPCAASTDDRCTFRVPATARPGAMVAVHVGGQKQPANGFRVVKNDGGLLQASQDRHGLLGHVFKLSPETKGLPDWTTLGSAFATVVVANLDVAPRSFEEGFPALGGDEALLEWFGIRFTGDLEVPAEGDYGFALISDDGTRLWIDGHLVIENDGIHPPIRVSATAHLGEGLHDVVVEYFQGPRNQIALQLFWRVGDDEAWRVVPASTLFRPRLAHRDHPDLARTDGSSDQVTRP